MKKNIILLIVTIIASVLIVDLIARHPFISLRFYQGPGAYYYNRFPKIHKTLRSVGNINIKADVTGQLSWMLGNKVKDRKILFQTDASGFRNFSNYQTDYYNTIILGDSFGFSAITDQKDLLSEQLNNAGYSTYNISAEGIGLWAEVVTLKYEMLFNLKTKGKTNIVWLLFEGNDLEGDFYDEVDPDKLINNKFKEISVAIENYYKRSVIKMMVKRILSNYKKQQNPVTIKNIYNKKMLFFEPYKKMLNITLDGISKHHNFEAVNRIFRSTAEFVNRHGYNLTCVVIPVKARVYEWVLNNKDPWSSDISQSPFSKYIQELCELNKISFLDLTPDFIVSSKELYENKQATIYWLDDTHWNVEGQAIAASIIDNYLKKNP